METLTLCYNRVCSQLSTWTSGSAVTLPGSRAAAMLSSDRCVHTACPTVLPTAVITSWFDAIITTRSTAPFLVKPRFKRTFLRPNKRRLKHCFITWADLGFLFARPVIFFLLSPRRCLLLRVWLGSDCTALKRITAPQRLGCRTAVTEFTYWSWFVGLCVLCFHLFTYQSIH